ncbi:MAG: 2,3-bisphosphoglycerate-independent phosphoglycerate mutase [Nitrososphaeria archaeon]|nr:2,3-bisphosphoglycerate-independent phosphoglycerate mutase [Nitrososphaeria archaeon]
MKPNKKEIYAGISGLLSDARLKSKIKMLMVIGDGMADRAVEEIGWRSPLEVAETPNMDLLARRGVLGFHDPLWPGLRVESEAANLSILGYDPLRNPIKRGLVEALGLEVSLERGDVALRTNFATIRNGKILDRRAGRFNWDPKPLADDLNKIEVQGGEAQFYTSVEHRGVLVLSSEESLSADISDTDPHTTGVPPMKSVPTKKGEAAIRTTKILNEYLENVTTVLSQHPLNQEREKQDLLPANGLITRGAGTLLDIPRFLDMFGVNGAVICGFPMIKGLVRFVGLETPEVEGATGRADTNFDKKAEAAIKALEEFDFVYVHVKAIDSASHDGKVYLKMDLIEKMDSLIGRVLDAWDDLVVCVTADHSTPLGLGDHCGDPVPFLIWFPNIIRDEAVRFSEREAYKGGFQRIRSVDLMNSILCFSGRCQEI